MSRDDDVFDELFAVIESRREDQPSGSYTASLLGADRSEDVVLEKVGEETVELVLAAKTGEDDRIVEECADVFYHVLVLLAAYDVPLDDVRAALRDRRG